MNALTAQKYSIITKIWTNYRPKCVLTLFFLKHVYLTCLLSIYSFIVVNVTKNAWKKLSWWMLGKSSGPSHSSDSSPSLVYFFHMFISRSCHLYSYLRSSVAGGWLRLSLSGPVGASQCERASALSLCTHVHSASPDYFQSILFKDQTRGWWLIFLSLAFFHLLGKRRRGAQE